mgnify:CR=1 FL=1
MTAEYHMHPTRSSLSAPSLALLRLLRSTIGLFAALCHIKIRLLLISAQNSAMLLRYIPFFEDNMTRSTPELSAAGSNRLVRLLRIAQEIRCYPQQTQEALQKKFGISRSQYYKDKAALAETGFCFTFNRKTGFRITEDRLTPITGLTLSDRLVLMFALEYLSSEGDGTLAALAVERGCGRLEWWCLDWNRPSIDFYLSPGAEPMKDWTVYRIAGDALQNLAR